jgi:polyribonucleotide nucleotidyltransferase
VRLARVDGQYVPFPTQNELEESDLDLVVSGSDTAILMIEGFAREVPEGEMAEALIQGHRIVRDICAMHRELAEKVGVAKAAWVPPDRHGLLERLRDRYYSEFKAAKQTAGKQLRAEAVAALKARAVLEFIPDPAAADALDPLVLDSAWHELESRVVRDLILSGTRPDGRDATTLREIECTIDVLPRTHGSAVFQRGETQSLVTVTLGTAKDEQRVDGLIDEYSKKFMLDYYFPPFSVGECRPIRGPGRREIGHGALAERSVKPVLPSAEAFPYTVRVVSDILESNGSSSMATVCGATLALMAAGVPISNPVAGISIGLVKEPDGRWVTLTDIIGDEDHFGDMDFKVAGTQNGITGIQLDLKTDGIGEEIIRATLGQARDARMQILRKILTTIREPRAEISCWAPRLLRTKIDPDKIGALIGPGGSNVRRIQESTGTVIEIEEDGTVTIASTNKEWAEQALAQVEALTASVQVGKVYTGKVTSIKDFGAFVEILPGRDGLCHISELSGGFVNSVSEVCKVGDEMKVLVIDVDEHDRVKLSRRRALEQLGIPDTLAGAGGGEERARRKPRDAEGGDREYGRHGGRERRR